METRANHVLIGAFTLLVALMAVAFTLWIAKYTSDRAFDEYDIIFKEAVTGLSKGGIVQYNGIAVGEVRDLSLDRNDPRKVIARIRVSADTPVKVDTKAKLAIVGLTGVAQIQLSGGRPQSERLQAKKGESRPSILADTSAFQKLLESTDDIATTASDVLLRLKRVLDDDNLDRVARSMANIEAITGAVAGEGEDLGAIIRNAREASERLQRVLADAETVMAKVSDREVADRLPEIAKRLESTLKKLDRLAGNADAVLAANRDGLDSLGQQGLPQVGPALSELRRLLRDLDRVAGKLEDNPAGFVLGRSQPEEFEP